ncbi:hypothetical protein [Pelagibius sp.]|uniref:hypothetical protein n=1 Tax=Pelagibius sp. TaxID=1931238 RepID=UPI002617715C|nr:hypothetical protein [Pelagibius sp.]
MACEIFFDFVGAGSETSVLVQGRIDGECRRISVRVVLSTSVTVQEDVDVPGSGLRDWSVTIEGVEPGVLSSACKDGRVTVLANCVDGGDCEASQELSFVCCPDVLLKKLDFSSDCVQSGPVGYAAVTLELEVLWPEGYEEELLVSVAIRPVDPPQVPTTTVVIHCAQPQSVYTDADFASAPDGPTYVIAGLDYEVTLRILEPERCQREIPIQSYSVPACECDSLPNFDELFDVFDAEGQEIADIHGIDCVDSASLRIVPSQIPTDWEVAGDPDGNTITVSADQSEATVTLPEDGSVAIVLVTFGEGSCKESVPISAQRCVEREPDEPGGDPTEDPGEEPGGDPTEDPTEDPNDDQSGGLPDFCSIFATLFLIGIAVAAVGLVLLVCPMLTEPAIPTQYALIIGGALLAVGLFVMLFMLFLMWLFNCPLGPCTWRKWAWQAAFIVGAVAIYGGLCPGCSWLLLGFLLWGLAVWFFLEWRRLCRPSICLQFAELLLATIAFDIAAVLEGALGFCVITSNGFWALVWAAFVVAFNVFVYEGLRRNNCLRG